MVPIRPFAYYVDGGKKNGLLLHDWQYHNDLVVDKVMCKPMYSQEQVHRLIDAMVDSYSPDDKPNDVLDKLKKFKGAV